MLDDLKADRSRLAYLAAQILDLERSLSALRAEQTLAQGRLDAYKYPILTLPNEITSEIFIHFLPIYPAPPPLIGIHSPTFLTRICRTWREIALATPQLWRSIGISGMLFRYRGERRISEAWANRSKTCPLSININDRSDIGPTLLAGIIPHRARWEHLRLLVPPHSLAAMNGPMPLLRHLDLDIAGASASAGNNVLTFHGVPLLRTVILQGGYVLSRVTLPWEQLTSLTLKHLKPSACAPILQQARNLVHCDLQVWNISGLDDYQGPDIVLPYLESLVLGFLSVRKPTTDFIHTFMVPALRTLELPENCLGPYPVVSLESFILKSGCTLQKLRILQGNLERENSYPLAFPSIPDFSFTRSDDERLSETNDNDESTDDDEDSEIESGSHSSHAESDSESEL
ncbi:hypothetical protein DFH08DRAFT_71592 [Mycena albidolilacea]|uniref:F-box domain-containing protein n=1 Tax=Mycena albidolilacea TaxID=1033008 RepID=A0AAD6Z0H1_9AGAR|nr:hypothetical protein DFH08DRAFT_71592 [Mycena albidolilacea]